MGFRSVTVEEPDTPKTEDARYVLVLFQSGPDSVPAHHGELHVGVVTEIRRQFEDQIQEPREAVTLDLWLESPGGDLHAAYKLAVLLRAYAHKVRAIIPDYAKSAATLLVLAADEIYMGPAAELGPLDAQIPVEGGPVQRISALDVARSLDHLSAFSLGLALNGGAEVLRSTRLGRTETLTAMLAFSASYMEPIIRQLEPTYIHFSSALLDASKAYAERLLEAREHADEILGQGVAEKLVEDFPTHGFVICRQEAKELGLPVKDLSEYDFSKYATGIHRAFEDQDVNVCRLISQDALDAMEGSGDGEED